MSQISARNTIRKERKLVEEISIKANYLLGALAMGDSVKERRADLREIVGKYCMHFPLYEEKDNHE